MGIKNREMSRLITKNLVEVYEKNGTELKELRSKKDSLIVREHWNIRAFVVLEINGESITVLADDLNRAIENAQNAHKY